MIGLGLNIDRRWGGIGAILAPADFVVTTQAEWNAVLANSTASLDGKVMEVAAEILDPLTISGHDFPTGFEIRSANASSTIQRLEANGTVSRLILSNGFQMRGWPKNYDECVALGTGVFDEWLIDGATMRHGYGPSQVPFLAGVDYPEYVRPDNVVTATTTSTRYPLAWLDTAIVGIGRHFAFNRGSNNVWLAYGDNTVTAVVGTADTDDPTFLQGPKAFASQYRRTNGDPSTETHFAVITDTGTSEVNIRSEIGLGAYMADGFTASGSAQASNWTIQNSDLGEMSNCFAVPLGGTSYIFRNRGRVPYQDFVKAMNSTGTTYAELNHIDASVAKSGIAEDLDGHANDNHGDEWQGHGAAGETTGPIIFVGNTTNPVTDGRSQGRFLTDRDHNPSYELVLCIGEQILGGSPNGISIGEINGDGDWSAGNVGIFGCTVVPHDALAERSNINVLTNEPAVIMNTIISGQISNADNVVINSLALDAYIGPEETYFPNWDDLATATTPETQIAALTTTGDAAGMGVAANASAINRNATVPGTAANWGNIPALLAFENKTEQVNGNVITWAARKVLNLGGGQTITPPAGMEVQVLDTDNSTVITAWTGSSAPIAFGQYVAIRMTAPAPGVSQDYALITNGIPQPVSLHAADVIVNGFTADAAYFKDPANLGADVTQLRFQAKFARGATAYSGDSYLGGQVSAVSTRISDTAYAVCENTNGSAAEGATTAADRITMPGQGVVVVADTLYDYAAGTLTFSAANQTKTADFAGTTGGTVQSARPLMANTSNTGAAKMPAGSVFEYFRWIVTRNGVDETYEISVAEQGSIALINAHPWANGTVVAA